VCVLTSGWYAPFGYSNQASSTSFSGDVRHTDTIIPHFSFIAVASSAGGERKGVRGMCCASPTPRLVKWSKQLPLLHRNYDCSSSVLLFFWLFHVFLFLFSFELS
jgi:hypothetical protein